MKDTPISRRDFLKNMGIAGAGAFLAASPWLSAFSEVTNTSSEKCRLAIIGPGSRGRFLMSFLVKNPKVDIVALCDIYQPSIDEALKLAPKAKVYGNYKEVLEDKNIDAVLVATPLSAHYKIVMDAFDAGKHVFCEKSIGYTMEECYHIYQKHRSTGKIFFTGQQRLFDPRYIKAMEMIHAGTFGEINGIHTFWNRNGDWRRSVPSPSLERLINWRLYKEFSKGLMTELACHQLQIGSWALQKLPEKVMGHGAITYWKDGREVYDNVSCIYVFDDGVKMTFDSIISNKFYGLEEQIMGNLGTVEPEKGRYYFESVAPAPAFLQSPALRLWLHLGHFLLPPLPHRLHLKYFPLLWHRDSSRPADSENHSSRHLPQIPASCYRPCFWQLRTAFVSSPAASRTAWNLEYILRCKWCFRPYP